MLRVDRFGRDLQLDFSHSVPDGNLSTLDTAPASHRLSHLKAQALSLPLGPHCHRLSGLAVSLHFFSVGWDTLFSNCLFAQDPRAPVQRTPLSACWARFPV